MSSSRMKKPNAATAPLCVGTDYDCDCDCPCPKIERGEITLTDCQWPACAVECGCEPLCAGCDRVVANA